MDIQHSFERFLKDRQAMQVSPHHIKQLQHKFKMLGRFLESRDIKTTDELNSEILADFMLQYIQPENGRKYSDWYIRGIANTVRSYIRFLVEMRIIPERIPFSMPRFHRPLPPLIEADRMQQIIDACDDLKLRLLMAFFFDTGLRRSEVCDLVWADVSFETGTVLVRHGKGDKFRYVPLGKTVIRLLARYKADIEAETGFEPLPSDPVFPSSTGKPYSARGMTSLFARLSEKVGFRVTAHALRRGYAKTARKLGRDWEDIQQSMGHTSIDQTRMYVGFLSQDDVQKARPTSPVDRALRITSASLKKPRGKHSRTNRKKSKKR